MSEPDEPHAE
jgi:hypothetical protein